jgi:uncharacterized protein YdhG (YjbR/CyaY superfamily)
MRRGGTSRKPETIDDYLASVTPDRRAALERLRRTIRSLVPDAEECISYSMPAFRYGGKVVAGFLATAKGCSYYPFSGTTLSTLSSELEGYDRTKSALHFDPRRPLPRTLVASLLEARVAETRAGAGADRPASKAARKKKPSSRPTGSRRGRALPRRDPGASAS